MADGKQRDGVIPAFAGMTSRLLALLSVLGGLLLVACFDLRPPVEERLLLSFQPGGALRVRLTIELRHPEGRRAASNLGRRLRQREEELLAGWDPWSRRFGEAGAGLESFYWEKAEGRLVYLERGLVLEDPAELAGLLADTPIHATYRLEDGIAELALYPGTAGEATRRERRQVERALEDWSGTLAAYFEAAAELYGYLELRPDRALACFGNLFENDDEYGELTAREEPLLEALGDATSEILEVLDVDDERAYSLDELSRKVYDPFPARFTVELPAPAVEVEGFRRAGEGWAVPGLSLWPAFELLEGEWLAPDPLIAWVAHQRAAPDDPFDVRAFAARGRSAHAAGALEVLGALEAALTPADVYRLTWRAGSAADS